MPKPIWIPTFSRQIVMNAINLHFYFPSITAPITHFYFPSITAPRVALVVAGNAQYDVMKMYAWLHYKYAT